VNRLSCVGSVSPDGEARLGSDSLSAARAKYLLAILFFVCLAIFGARYHWVEGASTAERDAFADKAELVLGGHFPRDLFRPPLYVLLMAGLAPVVGGPFVAGRIISNLAACGLALAAFGFGARLKDRQAGLWSMGLVLVNPNIWIFGEQAATNMLFACFAASAVLAGLAYLGRPSARAALAAGVACALADWVRGNATTLVPALCLAYVLAPRRSVEGADPAGGRSPAHLGAAFGGAVVVMAPLWWLRWRYFGSPFYDENWRNLWWKLHAHSDWSLLENGGPRSSFGRLILGEPWAVCLSALREFANFFVSTLPALVGGWWCLPPLVVAVVAAIRRRSADAVYLLFALGTFTFGVAVVFFTWDRFMLLWIPIAAALSIAECHRLGEKWRPRGGALSPGVLMSAGLVALTLTSTVVWKLPAFVRQHPYAEVAALAPLDREIQGDEALAGTAPFLQRYLEHRYVHLPDDTGLHGVDDYHDWCAVERLLRSTHVKYVAVSDVELRHRPRSLLGGGEAPPAAPTWLELVRKDAHTALWRVRDAADDSARTPSVSPCR
jgi:hypothetical protein